MSKWIYVAAVVAACACTPSGSSSQQPSEAGFVSSQTALIAVNLFPDGTANITEVSPRPIRFRDRGARRPFDEELHALRVGQAKERRNRPARRANGSAGDDSSVVEPDASVAAVVIRHPQLQTPMVLPIDLGQPGEGGGDVTDRWHYGSVILRVPCLGDGTHYTVMRPGRAALAEGVVAPGRRRR